MSFIQITDLHFVPGDTLLYGTSPKDRLAQGIELINRDHKDNDFVLITGDLAHHGEIEAYRTLRQILDQLKLPYHLMMGNHDSRAPFRQIFPEAAEITGGFVQFSLDCGDYRLICIDTLEDIPGDHAGRMCQTRLDWLHTEIAATPASQRMIVAGHHPFFDLGLPNMDDIKLRDSEALIEVFERRKPDLYLYGHVHRPINGVYNGIPFHTQRAFNHQVALDFKRNPVLMFSDEQPDIAIIRSLARGFGIFTRSVGGEKRIYPAREG